MTAQQLMVPRFEVIGVYPYTPYAVGDLVECIGGVVCKLAATNDTEHWARVDALKKYPYLFRQLNWWERRETKDMPKKLRFTYYNGSSEVFEIVEWDIKNSIGWGKEETMCCDCALYSSNPEHGYFPVD